MGGVEICRMIRAESQQRVPVLLATAHAMRGDAEKLIQESDADGYVAKPIVDHDEFARLAMSLMERAA